MHEDRGIVRKNNRRHPSYISVFLRLWMLSAHLFSVEQVYFWSWQMGCSGCGWLTMNIMRKSLFINHIPKWECDVPTRCRGQVLRMADNKWDLCQLLEKLLPLWPVGCFKIKFEMCLWKSQGLWLVYELTFCILRCSTMKFHILYVILHLLCRCKKICSESLVQQSYHTHKGVRSAKSNYLSHTITSVAELQCGNVSYIIFGTTWQNCAKTHWLIIWYLGG